jgi:hypothetical protein
VARIGWVRDTSQTNATSPTKAAGILNIPGSQTADGPIALTIGSGVSSFIDSPIDMDTQRARFQAAWQQNGQLLDDITKTWGKHQIQFGAQLNKIDFTHARADNVVGSITSLVAQIDGDQTYLTIPSVNEPAVCGGSVTSNCVPSSQLEIGTGITPPFSAWWTMSASWRFAIPTCSRSAWAPSCAM